MDNQFAPGNQEAQLMHHPETKRKEDESGNKNGVGNHGEFLLPPEQCKRGCVAERSLSAKGGALCGHFLGVFNRLGIEILLAMLCRRRELGDRVGADFPGPALRLGFPGLRRVLRAAQLAGNLDVVAFFQFEIVGGDSRLAESGDAMPEGLRNPLAGLLVLVARFGGYREGNEDGVIGDGLGHGVLAQEAFDADAVFVERHGVSSVWNLPVTAWDTLREAIGSVPGSQGKTAFSGRGPKLALGQESGKRKGVDRQGAGIWHRTSGQAGTSKDRRSGSLRNHAGHRLVHAA